MDKLEPTFSGLDDKEITEVLNLLGADFGDAGKISEINFFDFSRERIRIVGANYTGSENNSDIK